MQEMLVSYRLEMKTLKLKEKGLLSEVSEDHIPHYPEQIHSKHNRHYL